MTRLTQTFHATDRITLGQAVFDTLLVREGDPVHGPAHMDRLIRHARILGIDPPMTRESLLDRLCSVITENNARAGLWRARTILSAGEGPPGLAPPPDPRPTLSMTLAPTPDPASLPPLRLILARSVRRNEQSPLSRLKSTNYGDNILAAAEARARGAMDAVLLNTQGRAACASAGNLFVLTRDDALVTPPCEDGAMDGIIRGLLLTQGARERSLTPQDLTRARGIYVTSSLAGLRPAISLEGHDLPTPLDFSARFDLF